jgi:GGDEF domain-containing protein
MELHPRLGFNVVGRLPALRDVARAILHHHERWDGEGYPAGLAGESIPRPARALAVLEAYGAMVHDRPHRPALDVVEACQRLVEGAGRQFDPEVVRHLVDDVRDRGAGSRGELAEVVLEALPLDPALVPGGGGALAPLGGAATDGLTLLGNQRALQQDLRDAARVAAEDGAGFGVVLVRLEDLADVNDREGLAAGDRLLQLAGRDLQRMAARAGGTAYRTGGRRLAVLAPLVDGRAPDGLADEATTELAGRAATTVASAAWRPGDRGEDVLDRARAALPSGPAGDRA